MSISLNRNKRRSSKPKLTFVSDPSWFGQKLNKQYRGCFHTLYFALFYNVLQCSDVPIKIIALITGKTLDQT